MNPVLFPRMLYRGICLFGACAMIAAGTEPLPATGPTASLEATTPSSTDPWVTVGSVRVNSETHSMLVTGWVNQVFGLVELLACGPGGKTHESVFVLETSPIDFQAALLLLGIKPGTPPRDVGVGRPQGPKLDIWVDWKDGAQNRRERAERFITDLRNQKPLPTTPWIFTGSVFENGKFMALAEESLIASYWDPWAIINIPLPCGADDTILVVNTNAVPPLRTPIQMQIKAR